VIFISHYLRSCGILIGLAIGDAMGAPLEGSFAPRERVTEMLPGGLYPRRKGEVTDDTMQALAVAQTLIICRRLDPSDLMARFLAEYKKNPQWFGPTSSKVFDLIIKGIQYDNAAEIVHKQAGTSRSNGSVMRGFPIGIYYAPTSVPAMSIVCSRLTHYDLVAAHSSVWLNLMTSSMCRGKSREEAFRYASNLCKYPEVFDRLGEYQKFPPDPSLDALLCAHAALYCFMNADSFEDALISAINLGGDSDTVGACCGALAGAFWGIDAIPERWKQDLVGYTQIFSIAQELALIAEP